MRGRWVSWARYSGGGGGGRPDMVKMFKFSSPVPQKPDNDRLAGRSMAKLVGMLGGRTRRALGFCGGHQGV